jgi:hypothetical protein
MAMEPPSSDGIALCHARECGHEAAAVCDRCDQPFCADHLQTVTIERREDREGAPGLQLARAPTRRETYRLCRACSTKPVTAKRLASDER